MIGGLVFAMALQATNSTVYYVSPTGNDNWTGTRADSIAGKADGPFASLPKALSTARSTRARKSGPIRIELRGGVYQITKPVELGSEDSNLTIKAYKREKPILSGGVPIRNWSVTTGGGWEAHAPNGVTPVSIFVNGERRHRPTPSEAPYVIDEALPRTADCKDKGSDTFKFVAGDLKPNWYHLQDVEVKTIHIWGASRLRIKSINPETHTVTFTGSTRYDAGWATFEKGYRYTVENVREAMRPGDFYVDSISKILSYMPIKEETPTKTEVIVPITEQLIVLNQVNNVIFDGITFQNTCYQTPTDGRNFPQADADLSGMIKATACDNVKIQNCKLRNGDIYGIDLGKGCRNCTVENCQITDLGAGGIRIGSFEYEPDESRVAGYNTIRNNLLARLDRVHPAGIGVFIGHSPYNKVEHNDIEDLFYTGISIGWSWGYGNSNSHHNRIAYNHISKIGQGLLSDMGGIYLLGVAPGTVIENNLIHDVVSYSYGGWGIYLDEGSSNVKVQNNVVYRTKSSGFHQHYGKENEIRNNVFAFGGEAQLMRSREEEHQSFVFENNICYWKDAPLLGSTWKNNHFVFDKNVYWQVGGKPFDFAGLSLDDWRAKGQDKDSLIADPLFMNPDKDDFRLKPGSPAFKLGFKPIDLATVGRIKKMKTVS
jgi:parallel beta-helix repeat protein